MRLRKESEEVQKATTKAKTEFDNVGLVIYELDVHLSGGDVLGVHLDGRRMETRNTWQRASTLRNALQAILNRQRLAGSVLEVIVGHCTYFSLACQA